MPFFFPAKTNTGVDLQRIGVKSTVQLGGKQSWAGQQSLFKVKCGGNNLISSHDWTPGVPSVVLDFGAQFKPHELQKQSELFTHSSMDSQLVRSFWSSAELSVPPTDVDFLHINPLKSRMLSWPLFSQAVVNAAKFRLVTGCHA